MKSPDTVKVNPPPTLYILTPQPPSFLRYLLLFFEGVCIDVFEGVKLALVALKCDLRDDDGTKERLARYGEKCISYEEGLEMARQIHAVRYLGPSTHTLDSS